MTSGINRPRKCAYNTYIQATKLKPTPQQSSQTAHSRDTQDKSDTVPQVYDPWDTMKLFRHKTQTTKAESNNSCMNQVLNKLEQEIVSLAEQNKQNHRDNIIKAETSAKITTRE